MDHKTQYHLKQEAQIHTEYVFCREDSGTQSLRSMHGSLETFPLGEGEHRVSMLSLKYTKFLRDRAMIRTTHPFQTRACIFGLFLAQIWRQDTDTIHKNFQHKCSPQ